VMSEQNIFQIKMHCAALTLFMAMTSVSCVYQSPRTRLVQQQVCYYTPFSKSLTCSCPEGSDSHSLILSLNVFIKDHEQEVLSVTVDSCKDLIIQLDFRNINPSSIPFKFNRCGIVQIEEILFDNKYSGHQKINIELSNLLSFVMRDIELSEAFQLRGDDVKEVVINNASFSHIPLPGLELHKINKLEIINSKFLRISPGSISIDSTESIVVVNNQFQINAMHAVQAVKGSKLVINCNWLLDEHPNPECLTLAKTSTTKPIKIYTTTKEPTTTTTPTPIIVAEKQESDMVVSLDVLVGAVAGVSVVLLVAIIVLAWICYRKIRSRKHKEEKSSEENDKESSSSIVINGSSTRETKDIEDRDDLSESQIEEKKLLLSVDENEQEVLLVEASKPKVSSPVWLEEIHSNKIFNKQRNINVEEESDKDQPLNETPNRQNRPYPVRSISEILINANEEDVEMD